MLSETLTKRTWISARSPQRNADNILLAAVSAIAGQGSGAGAAEDVLTRDLLVEDGADVGLFGVKLWIGGRWRTMVLDDRFPCIKNQANDQWEPLFAKRAGAGVELWPLIFEKAWANCTAAGLLLLADGLWIR